MTDDAFLRELEACTLSERAFGHHAHVRAAYLYLGQSNFAEALVRMRRSICAYATHLGRPDRYHETITLAHLALIQRCIVEHGDRGGWVMFARSNPDLLDPDCWAAFTIGISSNRASRAGCSCSLARIRIAAGRPRVSTCRTHRANRSGP